MGKNLLSSALATFGKATQATLKAAQAAVKRTPLMTVGSARLVKVEPIAAGENTIELPDHTTKTYTWDDHFSLVFDLKIDGSVYEMRKNLAFTADALEKFHKGVDYAVSLTTGELSRYWDLPKQIEWLSDHDFPAYVSMYKGRECFRFGTPEEDKAEAEAAKALEEELNK